MNDLNILENENLAKYTSWKVGGDADYFFSPQSEKELADILTWSAQNKIKYSVLGGGTNVLVSDKGIRGLVICTKNLNQINDESDETNLKIRCGAGVLKMKAMRYFLKNDLSPALFLSGIPGNVAGGVVMNAGVSEDVSPKEFTEIVESFRVLSFENNQVVVKSFNHGDIDWTYRNTKNWQPGVISEVVLSFPKKNKDPDIKVKVREAQQLRSSKQPLDLPSCGSVFKNPYDDLANVEKKSAGFLIEAAGLKGYQYGGAEISRKHANFIVNKGEASASDIHCTISIAQKKVEHLFGIRLKTEVKYVGDWDGLI